MTLDELLAFATARHGEHFIGPLAEETGYDFAHVWKVVNGKVPISRRMELEIERLKRKGKRK